MLYAFDLIEHDGGDLRDLPLIDRKRRLELCSEGVVCSVVRKGDQSTNRGGPQVPPWRITRQGVRSPLSLNGTLE